MSVGSEARAKTPAEKYEEAKIELAVYKMMLRDKEALEASLSPELEDEAKQQADESLDRIMHNIDAGMKKTNNKRRMKQAARLLRVATMVVMIINMGLTVSVAASSTVRAQVVQFLTSINDVYMEAGFYHTDTEVEIPEGWLENYFPSYIPNGYSISQYYPYENVSTIVYTNSTENYIDISINGISSFTNKDTENADVSSVSLHGTTATVVQKNGQTTIVWAIGDRYFAVSTNTNYEVTLKVAESMTIIKK